MSKTCPMCGKEFTPDKFHPHQTYCSIECSQKFWQVRRRNQVWFDREFENWKQEQQEQKNNQDKPE